MNKQAGFTLIEISIVLVIIALILGGVLVGVKVLIANTKTTSTITLIKDLTGAVSDFKSRYRYLPGDLPNAGVDITGITAPPPPPTIYPQCHITPNGTIGNGLIDTDAEKNCVSVHLVLAGIIKGSATGIVSPFNGGTTPDVFVRATKAFESTAAVVGFPQTVQNVIEIQNIPCDAASTIDSKIDDGDTQIGRVRSTACVNGITTLDVAL
jgi:prepilin-type N-terminal cleavage/methylation domain-containing protein